MGNAQSPSIDPRFASASRAFTQKELEDLKALFVSLAAQSQSNGQYASPSVFKAYFGIHGRLGDRMFDLVTQRRNDQKLTFEDLVIAKVVMAMLASGLLAGSHTRQSKFGKLTLESFDDESIDCSV